MDSEELMRAHEEAYMETHRTKQRLLVVKVLRVDGVEKERTSRWRMVYFPPTRLHQAAYVNHMGSHKKLEFNQAGTPVFYHDLKGMRKYDPVKKH